MKTFDKPQHVLVVEEVEVERLGFDRERALDEIEAAELPEKIAAQFRANIDAGRYDDNPQLFTDHIRMVAPSSPLLFLAESEAFTLHSIALEERETWQWVAPDHELVDPEVRKKALDERKNKARG